MHSHIDELLAQDEPLPEILEQLARLGAQLLMQAALEADITEFLGRERYQRAAACEDARPAPVTGYPEGDRQDDRRVCDTGPPQAARHHGQARPGIVSRPAEPLPAGSIPRTERCMLAGSPPSARASEPAALREDLSQSGLRVPSRMSFSNRPWAVP